MTAKNPTTIKIKTEESSPNEATTFDYRQNIGNFEILKCEVEDPHIYDIKVKVEKPEETEIKHVDVTGGCNFLSEDKSENICDEVSNRKCPSRDQKLIVGRTETGDIRVKPSDNQPNNCTYTCRFCNIIFAVKSFYENHTKYCQYKYKCEFGNLIDIYKSSEKKLFCCQECSYSTNQKSSLKRHGLIHSAVRPFQCSRCEYSATQKVSLDRHENYKHNRKKIYHCEQCKYKCVNSRDLKRHKMIHDNKKPFVCQICQKGFHKNEYLQGHMYVHTGELKPFRCDTCDYQTPFKVNLDKHKVKHSRFYACQICDSKFELAKFLKTHMYTHMDNKPFKCTECTKPFRWAGTLRNHMKNKHSRNK